MFDSSGDKTFHLHSFPSMHGSSPPEKADEGRRDRFQPLFSHAADDAVANGSPDESLKLEAALEQSRKIGFEKGYADGGKEAVELARRSMEPCLAEFFRTFDKMTARHSTITGKAAENIIHLAAVIAEHILSAPIGTVRNKTIKCTADLQETIIASHGMALRIHPETMEALKQLAKSNRLQWPEQKHIRMVSDPLVDPKGVEAVSGPHQLEEMQKLTEAFMAALSEDP